MLFSFCSAFRRQKKKRKIEIRFVLIAIVFVFQAGITSAYQEKPCLDPTDPECPLSAPNKNLTQVRKEKIKETGTD